MLPKVGLLFQKVLLFILSQVTFLLVGLKRRIVCWFGEAGTEQGITWLVLYPSIGSNLFSFPRDFFFSSLVVRTTCTTKRRMMLGWVGFLMTLSNFPVGEAVHDGGIKFFSHVVARAPTNVEIYHTVLMIVFGS